MGADVGFFMWEGLARCIRRGSSHWLCFSNQRRRCFLLEVSALSAVREECNDLSSTRAWAPRWCGKDNWLVEIADPSIVSQLICLSFLRRSFQFSTALVWTPSYLYYRRLWRFRNVRNVTHGVQQIKGEEYRGIGSTLALTSAPVVVSTHCPKYRAPYQFVPAIRHSSALFFIGDPNAFEARGATRGLVVRAKACEAWE